MSDEPLSIQHKVREILFRYRATPLSNGKTPAEQYLQRQIRIQLDALKPVQLQVSTPSKQTTRQLSVGERVQARYYANNKNQWKLGTIIRKFGQLHYLIKLNDGYTFKRHIDQLRSSDVQPKDSVSIAPESSEEPDHNSNNKEPDLGDLTRIPVKQPEQIDFQAGLPEPAAEPTPGPVRRSSRLRRQPQYLRDYKRK